MAKTLAAVATLAKEMQASWKQEIIAVSASRGSRTTTAVSGMQHTHTWKQERDLGHSPMCYAVVYISSQSVIIALPKCFNRICSK